MGITFPGSLGVLEVGVYLLDILVLLLLEVAVRDEVEALHLGEEVEWFD